MPKESILSLAKSDFGRLFRSMTDMIKPFNKAMDEQQRVVVRRTKIEEEAGNQVVRTFGKVRNAEKQTIDTVTIPEQGMVGQGITQNSITAPLEFGKLLLSTGAYQMVSNMAADSIGYSTGSRYGSEAENIASGAAGGVVTGAMTGAMATMVLGAQLGSVIPVWGTAIGAAIGLTLGAVQGGIENMQNQDDSFKSVVKSQFDKVIAQQQKDIEMGSKIAAASEVSQTDGYGYIDTFTGMSEKLAGLEANMQGAMGEGYNEERKEGLRKQMTYLSGEDGQQMLEANKLIGEYQASLENEKEEILRKHQSEALQTIGDNNLDGAEAGRLLMEAQVAAENEYRKGEGYQLQLQTQTTMLDNMRADLSIGWENFGHTMSQEFTKGIERGQADLWKQLNPSMKITKDGLSSTAEKKDYVNVGDAHQYFKTKSIAHSSAWEMDYLPLNNDNKSGAPPSTHASAWSMDYLPAKKAFGMNYVPYDNFPALLHQGERVLTASEARTAANTTPAINITVNGLSVREEADVDRIAAELLKNLQKARFTYAP